MMIRGARAIPIATLFVFLLIPQALLSQTFIPPFTVITTNTTWDLSGSPFVIDACSVTVAPGATLTIAPGVVVKFALTGPCISSGGSLGISGALVANGTSAQPIFFTSFLDDAAGGDTNGDGSATAPAAGNWGSIFFASGAAGSISHAVVRYGGSTRMIYIASGNASVSLTNSSLTNAAEECVFIIGAGTNPTITGNAFSQNPVGVGIFNNASSSLTGNSFNIPTNGTGISVAFGGTASITNNTFATSGAFSVAIKIPPDFRGLLRGNVATGTGLNAVEVQGFAATLSSNVTWDQVSMPYALPCGGPQILFGATLTIAPGVVVKFEPGTSSCSSVLGVSGSLVANGTSSQPIVFTSLKDDAAGGDTNGDGNATAPAAGDWGEIFFGLGATGSISHAVVRYGGDIGGTQQVNMIGIQTGNASVGLTNSNITSTAFSPGLAPAVFVGGVGTAPTISNNTFSQNSVAIQVFGAAVPMITGNTIFSNSTGVSVSGGAVPHINFNNIQGNSTWGVVNADCRDNVPCSVTPDVDATNNFWGAANGPSGAGPGSGDKVSFHVNFSPFRTVTPPLSIPPPSITSVSPFSARQGETLTHFIVNGNNFQPTSTLSFSGNLADFAITYISRTATQIVASITVEKGVPTGARNVTVINPDLQQATLLAAFTVLPGRSNVAFFPGIKGSHLYTRGSSGGEARLWIPFGDSNMCALRPNDDGSGSSQVGIGPIYTRDILDSVGGLVDVYGTFEAFMDFLQLQGFIAKWRPFPYDWRLNVQDIAGPHAIILGQDGVVTDSLDLVSSINDLASSSFTKKVTIVTHSNGAFLAKELMRILIANGQSDKIDRIIMVTPPQLGTPQAIGALLHGDDQGIPFDHFSVFSRSAAREAGERMVGAYNLLLSQTYFSQLSNPTVITFDHKPTTNPDLSDFQKKYPTDINSYDQLVRFILGEPGESGARREPVPDATCPGTSDTSHPNVLFSRLLTKAQTIHEQFDTLSTTWKPLGVDVIQIVGSGEWTTSVIKYTSPLICADDIPCVEVLDHKSIKTQLGDGTVIVPSAAALPSPPVNTFYFHLNSYNSARSDDVHREHYNIMGAAPVQQLIFGLLDGDRNPSVNHINRIAGTGVDSLLITVASPVALHAFDSKGRHTGPIPIPNPAPKEFTGIEEGIPSGSLSSAGHNIYLGLAPDDRYRIELRGQAFGTFTLILEEFLDDSLLSTISYVDVPVSPTTKADFTIQHVADASQLQIDVDGDGAIDFTLTPGAHPNTLASLRILTAVVRALRLPAGIENSLQSKLEAAASALRRGDRQAATGVLGAFKNELEAQKGKKIAAAHAIGLIGIVNRLLTSI